MDRKVTEADFRMPEYRNAKVEDYEFREDGKLVRKDRWFQGIQSIRYLVYDKRDWEIEDVVNAVRKLAKDAQCWSAYMPDESVIGDIRLSDGSILRKATYYESSKTWMWQQATVTLEVVEWKEPEDDEPDEE